MQNEIFIVKKTKNENEIKCSAKKSYLLELLDGYRASINSLK